MTSTLDAPILDGGPPVDPDSPFEAQRAWRTRRAARRPTVRSRLRKLVSWLVAAAIVTGAVYAARPLVAYRLAGASHLSLGTASLAAADVSVPAPGDGQVVSVGVHPSQVVRAGHELAQLRVFSTTGSGGSKPARLVAPISGVVWSVAAQAGTAVQRGGAVIQMYDPAQETFHVSVGMATASSLRRGMRATLTGSAVRGSVPAVVDHVVAPFPVASDAAGAPPPSPGHLTVVLRPIRPGDVRSLTPGLQFTAVVDTSTAPPGAPPVVRVVGS